MDITEAQADLRRVYRGGYSGPLVSAAVWAVANAVYLLVSPDAGMAVLFFGGMLIFPLSGLILKATTGSRSLPKGHPSNALAMQSAFTVPIGLLVAIALGAYEPALFFPASLIIVGAHYLAFRRNRPSGRRIRSAGSDESDTLTEGLNRRNPAKRAFEAPCVTLLTFRVTICW